MVIIGILVQALEVIPQSIGWMIQRITQKKNVLKV